MDSAAIPPYDGLLPEIMVAHANSLMNIYQ